MLNPARVMLKKYGLALEAMGILTSLCDETSEHAICLQPGAVQPLYSS